MASVAATTGAARRRLAPPALTESLVTSYQTPAESFPDTPEPWSAMAGGVYGVAEVQQSSPDFGLAQPSISASQENAKSTRPISSSQLRLTVAERREPRGEAASKAKSSKLLTVRNTFIDVGLPSPMEQLRQAHSCPGSRLVTPQSCRSGRLLSPLNDASVESSAVSTVDTEEAAQPKDMPSSCVEQFLESPPPPHSTFGVHRLQTYDLPRHVYDPALYEASQLYNTELSPAVPQHPAYHAAASGYEAPQRIYEMPPQPFQQQHQQQAPFRWSEAQYDNPAAAQPQQQTHPSGGMAMAWGSEQLPNLLTGQGQSNVSPPAPTKPILQLDKVLPVTYPGEASRALGSAEVPTVGSAGHGTSECKPCAFYWKPQGCGNGVNCVFCHLCDSGEKKRRAKEKRVAMRMAKATGVYM